MATASQAITYSASQTRHPAGAHIQWLADGRLHLHHGPIDLVIGADGSSDAVRHAYSAAIDRFSSVLAELAGELALLRKPVRRKTRAPRGRVAARMWSATIPHSDNYSDTNYVTAMAAVAGAVADEILSVMRDAAKLDRIYVNNGGDIALYLHSAAVAVPHYTVGIIADPDAVLWSHANPNVLVGGRAVGPVSNDFAGTIEIRPADQVGGIATSGWKGRSHSLGLADLVTVLAPTAAKADVAATLIANAVYPDDDNKVCWPGVHRQPANALSPDSDLGSRLVTVHVDCLPDHVITNALRCGASVAEGMRQSGHILAAYGVLQGQGFVCEAVSQRTVVPDTNLIDEIP